MPCYWYILGGTTPIDSGGTIKVAPTDTVTYVVAMDLCGTITYDTVTVFDTGCAGPPAATFSYIASPAAGGMDTMAFWLTVTSGGIDSAVWSFGDGTSDTGYSPVHVYTVPPDSFDVCLSVYGPCGADTVCQWVHTVACTVPAVAFTSTVSTVFANTVGFTYTGSTLYVDSVVWYFGNGYSWGYGTGTFSYTYSAEGTYTVCAVAYSRCGNDTGCNVVNVSLGVPALTQLDGVNVYPNPAGDEITVRGAESGSVQIVDVYGEVMKTETVNRNSAVIDISGLLSGVYMVVVTDGYGEKKVVRVVKE
jgi:hypothetical protein